MKYVFDVIISGKMMVDVPDALVEEVRRCATACPQDADDLPNAVETLLYEDLADDNWISRFEVYSIVEKVEKKPAGGAGG